MSNRKDYTGNKYGYLTAIAYSRYGGRNAGATWRYLCDCGSEKESSAKSVNAGKVKSCGTEKCQYHRKLISRRGSPAIPHQAAIYQLFQRYLKQSRGRGIKWAITCEDFSKIVTKECQLCSAHPKVKLKKTGLRYNLVELVEHDKGYTPENSYTCCQDCRRIKGGLSLQRFLKLILNICQNLRPTSKAA